MSDWLGDDATNGERNWEKKEKQVREEKNNKALNSGHTAFEVSVGHS